MTQQPSKWARPSPTIRVGVLGLLAALLLVLPLALAARRGLHLLGERPRLDRPRQPRRHGRRPELHHRRRQRPRRRRGRRRTHLLGRRRTTRAARSAAPTSTAPASNQSFISPPPGSAALGRRGRRHPRLLDQRSVRRARSAAPTSTARGVDQKLHHRRQPARAASRSTPPTSTGQHDSATRRHDRPRQPRRHAASTRASSPRRFPRRTASRSTPRHVYWTRQRHRQRDRPRQPRRHGRRPELHHRGDRGEPIRRSRSTPTTSTGPNGRRRHDRPRQPRRHGVDESFIDGLAHRPGSRSTPSSLAGKATAKRTQGQDGKKIVVKVKVRAKERLTAKASGKIKVNPTYKLKPKTVELAAGETKTLKLKPTKAAAKKIAEALKRGEKAKAKVKVKLTDRAGNSEIEKLRVRLKR